MHERHVADALVIGGGPAGCATAIALSAGGRQVTLLERQARPHHKVCGEFLSWEAALALRRMGVDPAALGARPLRRLRLSWADQRLEVDLPFQAWSLSRLRLDEALLRQAVRSGVDLRRGCPALSLEQSRPGWMVRSREQVFEAEEVFLACGKRDLQGWRRVHPGTPDLLGLKLHLRLHPAQRMALQGAVELFLFDGGYAGLEPVEEDRSNLCFLLEKAHYQELGGDDLLRWLAAHCPALGTRLAGAQELLPAPLAVYRTPYGYLNQESPPPGLFRLGDQFGVIPSFAGDGIALALHSGLLAARSSLQGHSAADYAARARQDFRGPIRNARLAERVLSGGLSRRVLFRLARRWPELLSWGARQIRLGEGLDGAWPGRAGAGAMNRALLGSRSTELKERQFPEEGI